MSKAKAKARVKAKVTSRASTPSKASAKPKARPKAAAKSSSSGDWRAETAKRMRALILEADPEMSEQAKWIKPSKPLGTPTFSHAGIVCTLETYQKVVKLTFMYGASLPDPTRLFNASLEGGTRRALDIPEGVQVDAKAFKAIVKAAVALNTAKKKR